MFEACLHFANILYCSSYIVRDMLWLRLLSCGGLLLGILFYTCRLNPDYGTTMWHAVFLIINSVQIRRLLVERRELMLTVEQEQIAEEAFKGLSREDLVTMLTRAIYRDTSRLRDALKIRKEQLSPEEQALRAIAFSRLSRQELKILLTRRLWNLLKKLNPRGWRRGSKPPVMEARSPSEAAG